MIFQNYLTISTTFHENQNPRIKTGKTLCRKDFMIFIVVFRIPFFNENKQKIFFDFLIFQISGRCGHRSLLLKPSHDHRPCRWLAQAPLEPFTSRAYRLIELLSFASLALPAIQIACSIIYVKIKYIFSCNHT